MKLKVPKKEKHTHEWIEITNPAMSAEGNPRMFVWIECKNCGKKRVRYVD